MIRRPRLRRLLAGAACAATLALTALAGTASAASTLAPARTASTAPANTTSSTAGSHSRSVYLVVSSVPFPGTPTGTSGSTSSRVSPDLSRAGCSSGNKASWARLYLDSGGTICYGFTGILNGLNDGPAYEICSGNNTGYINSYVPYYGGIKTITFRPANNYAAEYYWYIDEFGDRLDFYVRTASISGYSGSAAC